LSDEEFWHSTPRQLSYLTKRYQRRQDHEFLLAGIVSATTANFSMCHPKQPLTPGMFIPGYEEPKAPEPTDQEIAERVNMILMPLSVRK
jgi:hypothetical protein